MDWAFFSFHDFFGNFSDSKQINVELDLCYRESEVSWKNLNFGVEASSRRLEVEEVEGEEEMSRLVEI